MSTLRVAAVQASYVLMNRDATIGRAAGLTADAAGLGAELAVFPEVFVPGTPIWTDTQPIWDGGEDWFALPAGNAVVLPAGNAVVLLAGNAVVLLGAASERLAVAAEHRVRLAAGVVGVNPVLPAGQVPAGFPARDRFPVRQREEALIADLDLRQVAIGRRHLGPVGHYNRPHIFRLDVDIPPRPAVTQAAIGGTDGHRASGEPADSDL
jgi:hypothetical protein